MHILEAILLPHHSIISVVFLIIFLWLYTTCENGLQIAK